MKHIRGMFFVQYAEEKLISQYEKIPYLHTKSKTTALACLKQKKKNSLERKRK